MTINNNQFISAAILQDYLVDKDTGAPLAAGVITLYVDTSRLTLKNWYYQTGSPGGPYTYIALPNPMTLSAVGTIQVNGMDVIPFFYPYEEDGSQTIQTYYVTVFNSNNVEQFTRENFPYIPNEGSGPDSGQQTLENLIPNGQFAAHTNLVTPANPTGAVLDGDAVVAPGGLLGWNYSGGLPDSDFIVFDDLTEEPTGLTGNPRWAVNISCTNATGSVLEKFFGVEFSDVNRFSSPSPSVPGNTYTYSFAALNNNAGSFSVTLSLLRFFGTGGASSGLLLTPIQTIVIPTPGAAPGWAQYSAQFTFPSNLMQTLGTNNDDFVAIGLVFPSGAGNVFNLSLTNFFLGVGDFTLESYPERPDNVVFASGIAGSGYVPAPDGSDLYLPMIYTSSGLGFDTSKIGDIRASVKNLGTQLGPAEAYCDGTIRLTTGYTSSGIPNSRLLNFALFDQTNPSATGYIPKFGTGTGYFTAFQSTSVNTNIYVTCNNGGGAFGTPVPPADSSGMTATGFTFTTQTAYPTVIPQVNVYRTSLYSFDIVVPAQGTIFEQCIDGTGGQSGSTLTTGFTFSYPYQNSPQGPSVFPIIIPSATTGTTLAVTGTNPCNYFSFATSMTTTGSSTGIPSIGWYVWYKVGTGGSDPAPTVPGSYLSGNGIQVSLLSTDTANEIAYKTITAIQGSFLSQIHINKTGSTLTAGSYFTFTSNPFSGNQIYALWYSINGAGTAPVLTNTILINCNVLSADDVFTVGQKTTIALNTANYAMPDLRGMFLRGTDPSAIWDPLSSTRASLFNNNYYASAEGTFEFSSNFNNVGILTSLSYGTGNAGTSATNPTGTVLAASTLASQTSTGGGVIPQPPTPFYSSLSANTIAWGGGTTSGAQSPGVFPITDPKGGPEARPINTSVNWIINI